MDFNFLSTNLVQLRDRLVQTLIVIVLAIIADYLLKITFKNIFNIVEKSKGEQPSRRDLRARTFLRIMNSIGSGIIIFIAVLLIFRIFNKDISTILAGAGIIGIAVGFGSQQFVKDIINGMFFLYQDQFGEGDMVLTNGITGRIVNVSLRTITIRDINGAETILSNGNITQITNYTKEGYNYFIDLSVGISNKVDDVMSVIEETLKEYPEKAECLGIQDMSSGKMTFRIKLKISYYNYMDEGKNLRYLLKKKFEEKGIDLA